MACGLLLRVVKGPDMRVAVPLFGTRVSPRFDCGAVLLVAEVANGTANAAEQVVDASRNSLERVARLRQLGVDTVICGAITGFLLRHLTANGIRVYPWVFCEASDALAALAQGKLPAPSIGGAQRGRGRGHRGRGGPRWAR